jgi:virulence-associated protein VagC
MTQPAPGWLRNLAAARAHYEERFGWPVAVQVAEQQLAVALGQVVDAITMPAELAARVHAQLSIAMQAGPVIAHPDGKRWTFLTQTASTMREDIVDGLADHDVRHAVAGTYTVIPTEAADAGWRWITEPRPNQMLPSAYAVVAIARRVCAAATAA